MTSPSAAHTGIALASTPEAHRAMLAAARADATVPPIATSADFAAAAEAMATLLVDSGHASWCPTCAGTGTVPAVLYGTRLQTCTRCHGARLNPFHGCTFQTETPCTCTTRCSVYQPQETPTP